MAIEQTCPECGTRRADMTQPCPTCGALGIRPDDKRGRDEEVRDQDLEPYVTLRYIARLFKILAVLMVVMLIGEVITGLATEGQGALITLLGEATRLIVLAGLMWGGGDITLLLIDAGHDVRVARILLGRIHADLNKRNERTDRAA